MQEGFLNALKKFSQGNYSSIFVSCIQNITSMKKQLLFFVCSVLISVAAFSQTGSCSTCTNGSNSNKNPNPLDGTGTLGVSFQKDSCGLNFVQSSVLTETRSAQYSFNANGTGFPTTCSISGLPTTTCAPIFKAFVYYVASYQSPTAPATTVSITNPNSVNAVFPATLIGTGGSKCWGETGTAVYRADVTSNISGNGNYAIDLNGFTNKNWEVDGVTLFIIYRDPLATYQGSLVLWDGDITDIDVVTPLTMTGFNTCAASNPGTGQAFLILSDRQANINGNQHNPVLNGATQTYPNDFWCWDQLSTNFTLNQTTSQFSVEGTGFDCYTWAMMGIYYQTNGCTTCSITIPTTVSVTSNSTPASCNQPNGTATANPSGGNPPYTYIWNTTPQQTNQTATGLLPGIYIVNVIDATGCSGGSDTILVQQTTLPDTLMMTAEFCDGDTSSVLYAPQGFSSYQWYLNSAAITGATNDSLVISPAQTTGYTVSFLLNGCIRNCSVIIQTIPSSYFLPDSTTNVFTPNGDGKNDIFYPYISKTYNSANIDYFAKDFTMKIYNRWGKIVYETVAYNPQWDGKINGKIADDGTYYWICTYINRCEPNKTVTKKGFVHLMN